MPALTPTLVTPATGTLQRLLALIRFVRPANLVTSAADILTGAVIAGATAHLASLVGASVSLYAGGVVLNDYFDRRVDAEERPERAIPAGLVSPPIAAGLGAALLLLGVGLAFHSSRLSGIIGALLAAAILLYDSWAKPRAAGPVVMGSCRALNLLLGLSIAPAALAHTGLLALLPLLYIVAITTLSRGEVHGGSASASGFALLLLAAVLVGLGMLGASEPHRVLRVLPFALLLFARVAPPFWQAYRTPTAEVLRIAVRAGILSLIVLDAALAAPFGGIIAGAAVLSLAVVAGELARIFPVT